MKVIGICGSLRGEKSTTRVALEWALNSTEAHGVETEIIDLGAYTISPCIDCSYCAKTCGCSQDDDFTKILLPKLMAEDIAGFIFASPVYFAGVSSTLKAFFDRTMSIRRNNFMWENRLAGAVTVGRSRHGGQELAALDILHVALVHGMVVVSDASPTSHFGGTCWSGGVDGIASDTHGRKTAENLGKKMGILAQKLF